MTGAGIRAFRRRLGMSPGAFARTLRLHGLNARSRVHEWETEKREPPAWLGLLIDMAADIPTVGGWLQEHSGYPEADDELEAEAVVDKA